MKSARCFCIILVACFAGAAARGGDPRPALHIFGKPGLWGCPFEDMPAAVAEVDKTEVHLLAKQKVQPTHVAYCSGGKVTILPLSGPVVPERMSQAWLLLFGRIDSPLLVVLVRPPQRVDAGKGGVKLTFTEKAGTVVTFSLFGRLPAAVAMRQLGCDPDGKWEARLPERLIAYLRDWTSRFRCIPVQLLTKYRFLKDGSPILFEEFRYRRIVDAWKTPQTTWAMMPPVFALAEAAGGPIELDKEAKKLPWLGPFGPLVVRDGRSCFQYTIRIPQVVAMTANEPPRPPTDLPDPRFRQMRDKLRAEIGKILDADAPLAPFVLSNSYRTHAYWANPGETILTLCWALPYLTPQKADALKAYLRGEYRRHDPLSVTAVPQHVGVRREWYTLVKPGTKLRESPARKGTSLHSLYALWHYVHCVAGEEEGAKLWPGIEKAMEDSLSGYVWSGGEKPEAGDNRTLENSINGRLNGYMAFGRFGWLTERLHAVRAARCLLARGLAVKYALAHYHQYLIDRGVEQGLSENFPPGMFCENRAFRGCELACLGRDGLHFGKGIYGARVRYAFLRDLSPEVGRFLRQYCRDPVTSAVRHACWRHPGHWMSKSPHLHHVLEELILQPWVPWCHFLARALVMQEPPEELYWYVGDSLARLGDLYHMQKLVLFLRAAEGKPKG